MKKLLLTTMCMIYLICQVTAQTSQGTISLGGALGVASNKFETGGDGDDDKVTTVFIIPSAGYFLADRMELGLDLSFTKASFEDEGDDAGSESEIAFGPYFKYYMFTSNENFAFTLKGSLLFGSTKSSPPSDIDADDLKGKSLEFSISPGFTYFFTDKFGLDFQLQGIAYRSEDPDTDSDSENDKESTFIFGAASFNPSLGFRYFIGR